MTYVYRMNFDDGRPAAHFDTFPIALLTVFQVKSLQTFNKYPLYKLL